MLQLRSDLALGVTVQHHVACDGADSWLPTHLGSRLPLMSPQNSYTITRTETYHVPGPARWYERFVCVCLHWLHNNVIERKDIYKSTWWRRRRGSLRARADWGGRSGPSGGCRGEQQVQRWGRRRQQAGEVVGSMHPGEATTRSSSVHPRRRPSPRGTVAPPWVGHQVIPWSSMAENDHQSQGAASLTGGRRGRPPRPWGGRPRGGPLYRRWEGRWRCGAEAARFESGEEDAPEIEAEDDGGRCRRRHCGRAAGGVDAVAGEGGWGGRRRSRKWIIAASVWLGLGWACFPSF
jgi:hypothetical protein